MKREGLVVGILWLILTAVGEVLAVLVDFYPVAKSDKGEEIEKAFRILLIAAVPAFTLVGAMLLYSMLRHQAVDPTEDGPPLQGRGPVPLAWVGVTAGLTLLLLIYPRPTHPPKIMDETH